MPNDDKENVFNQSDLEKIEKKQVVSWLHLDMIKRHPQAKSSKVKSSSDMKMGLQS